MPLNPPKLDDRTYQQLVDEAVRRIPRYTKEWTDFNDSDPGITLVQLFSWLTELQLYQMNRIPERNYLKFLQMLNMELRPAQPAVAHLSFTARENAEQVSSIRQGTRIGADAADGEPLIFEMEQGVDLIRVPLTSVQVFDGVAFQDTTSANTSDNTVYRPFGVVPQAGAALYLGFEETDQRIDTEPEKLGRRFPRELRFRVNLSPAARAGQPVNCREVINPPAPPVSLVWEYRERETDTRWKRLDVFVDETAAFTREGYVQIEGPETIARTLQGKVGDPLYWIRCRLEEGRYPAGGEPEIDRLLPNTAPARNLATVREEVVGISDAAPDQIHTLARSPVQPDSLALSVDGEDGVLQPWTQVPDFLASGADDPHYRLNATTGEVVFGDGSRGRIPTAGAQVVAREYRYGGGARGNVPAGAVNQPLTALVGVDEVTNPRPAVGGRDEQRTEDLAAEAPALLRSRNRAVTAEDFAAYAKQAGGIAKASAIPLAHPDHPGVDVPGAVTVVVVPDIRDQPPQPSPEQIRAVCRYLDQFRLITTELFVRGPVYRAISVEARIEAHPYASLDAVARDANRALDRFLDPLGRDLADPEETLAPADGGWGFGQELYPTSLFSVILGVKDVAAVPHLAVYVNGRPHDNINQPIVLQPNQLLYGDEHNLTVVRYQDR